MATDKEKAKLRGQVQRTETKAKSLIHNQVEPFRDYVWTEEISVYDAEGKILEKYSPENQVMEQESIRHLFIYDKSGKLIEKQGYGEGNSAEDTTRYFYDESGKMTESIYTNFQGFSKHHIFYDERGNVKIINTYNGKDGSLQFVQKFSCVYEENGNKLEERYFKEEGNPPFVIRSSHDNKRVTTFDDAGNKIRVEKYLYDWLEEVETYNRNGQKIEYKLFSEGDTLASHYIYTYDANENLIALLIEYGSEIKNYFYEYDEWNNLIKSVEYKNDLPESEENITYEYDSQKNWTKRIEIKSNEQGFQSTTEFERTISYF